MSLLWTVNESGFREATLPAYEYTPLKHDQDEQRFLVLHPCVEGEKGAAAHHVKCEFDIHSLSSPKPYIAVRNARGYRKLQELIELDGKCLLISVALERFLRHYRRSDDQPVLIWTRAICLQERDEEERQLYWNRPYVESMYERAALVVDMAEFVSTLVERGVIERVMDSRYKEWRKDWEGAELPTAEQMQLPSVFPIRLGQRLSNEAPIDNYEYVPLDMVADEIRVLLVAPSEDPLAPLVLHLAHCPAYCEVSYHALSYTWGDLSQPSSKVIINGQKATVRQNLEKALRALRHPEYPLVFWVDAVCINQFDKVERNRQLSRMSGIYDRAFAVVCYVGETTEDSGVAMDFVKDLQVPMMRFRKDGSWQIGKDEEQAITPELVACMCAALYRFLTRPYFQRAWVLQEVAAASIPSIACGHRYDVSFEMLDAAAYNLQDMIGRDPELVARIEEILVPQGLQRLSTDGLAFVRKLLYFRHLHMKGSRNTLIQVDIKDTAPGYLETAILARDFHASVPHDKIYALWNLARDKEGLEYSMDYAQTVEKAFTTFTTAWAKQKGSLDIIGAAEFTKPQIENDFYAKAPSWCADWSTPSKVSSLIRREKLRNTKLQHLSDMDGALYAADGGMRQLPKSDNDTTSFFHFDPDNTVLYVTGTILDRITTIHKSPNDDTVESVSSWLNAMIATTYTYFSDQNPHLQTYNDPQQALWAIWHGDSVAAWPPKKPRHYDSSPSTTENIESDDGPSYVCRPHRPNAQRSPRLPDESRHVPWYGGSYSQKEAFDVLCTIMRGRTLFFSQLGYMGLAPSYSVVEAMAGEPSSSSSYSPSSGQQPPESKLLLAILATCSVPVLLQELPGRAESGEMSYGLLGTCFVQGWMDGEMVTGSGTAPEEFWNASKGVEKLKIV